MSKGYVNNTILDGQLGVSPAQATGIFAAVGVCSNPTNGIITLSDAEDAHEKLGGGPLRDMVCQALSIAKTTAYVIGLSGSQSGTIGSVTHTGTGSGTVNVSGSPKNDYNVKVSILSSGSLNEGVFQLTIDGVTETKVTVPSEGVYAHEKTGLTFTFNGDFTEGDSYELDTTAPVATNSEILTGVQTLLDSKYDYEFIAISGVTDETLWAALKVKADSAQNNYRYISMMCQARYKKDGESTDEWVNSLVNVERGTTVGGRILVCAAWGQYSDGISGEVDLRPAIGSIVGLTALKDIHEPIDHVGSSSLSGITKIMPEDLNDGHIDSLDNAGFVTLCQYIGKTGIYVTHARMFAESTSDFGLLERRRVMDYACKNVRLAQLDYINSTVAISEDGTIEGIGMFKAITNNVLEQMKKDGQISGYSTEIDETQNILSTETLKTRIKIIPLGKMSYIENVISYHNPNVEA